MQKAATELDDHLSDASSIALGVVSACARSLQAEDDALTAHVSLGEKVIYLRRARLAHIEAATQVVAVVRAAARNASSSVSVADQEASAEKAAFDCIVETAVRVDDHRSAPEAIARSALHACSNEIAAMEALESAGMRPEVKGNFLAELEQLNLSAAVKAIVSERQGLGR
jgi:hypothetical protein